MEKLLVETLEKFPGLVNIAESELLRVCVQIGLVQMAGNEHIDPAHFVEIKIITAAHLPVVQQSDHLLLGKRSEKQSERHIIVAVSGMKQQFKIVIAHQSIRQIVLQVAGEFFQLRRK